MLKRKLIFIIGFALIICLIIFGFIAQTEGWIIFQTNIDTNELSSAYIHYHVFGAFVEKDDYFYPDYELIDSEFSLENNSTVLTNLRMKISYTRVTKDLNDEVIVTNNYIFKNDEDDHLFVGYNDDFIYDDGYFYYISDNYELEVESGLITLISSLYYDGTKTKNEYFSQNITVKVILEAKQSAYTTWIMLEEYDFTP